ncbi:hypothetical protein CCPUN_09050 [Cardinium endosymbiont of Culicoides punctatus]|nr:hypothetical protein CCPUN_09050 [Cardinium endosymbiont of Culicoides punctatus]
MKQSPQFLTHANVAKNVLMLTFCTKIFRFFFIFSYIKKLTNSIFGAECMIKYTL